MDHDEAVFETETPVYGQNYGRGWIGFNHAGSAMSKGIGLLTRHFRDSGIVISHAFIVTGKDECVEAAFGKGVVRSSLTEQYFDNADRYVVFRKPHGLNDDIADRIARTAEAEVGTDFNNALLPNYVVQDSFVGWIINRLFQDNPKDFMAQLVNDEDRWICSELAAHCLNQQVEYHGKGILDHPEEAIEPQRLFEDDVIFDEIKATCD